MAKRKAPADVTEDVDAGTSKQQKKDGQKAISKNLKVPLDELFPLQQSFNKVYIDDEGLIYDVSLSQTNIKNNNNKFYRLQIIESGKRYYTHTRWGRLGEIGQVKTIGPSTLEAAVADFQKKFRDKSGHKWEDRAEPPKASKYTFIQKNYGDDDEDGDKIAEHEEVDDGEKCNASSLSAPVRSLVELIFNKEHFDSVLESIGYNNEKLPLGKLSKATLKQGFEHLTELAALIKDPNLARNKYSSSQEDIILDFSNRYYSAIPHIFGRTRAPVINDDDILQKESAMLDTLSNMEIAGTIMNITHNKARQEMLENRFAQLKLDELSLLDHKSKEYKALEGYFVNSTGHTHDLHYEIQEVFKVKRAGEDDRFLKSKFASRKDSCRRLLWHGSRTTNYGGILSQGLRIAPPEAPVNGYAFGKGVYLADCSSKSANYCMSSLSAGHGLLMLCEAELGNPMFELLTGTSEAEEACKQSGCIATIGKGRTIPESWVDAGIHLGEEFKGVLMADPEKKTINQDLPLGAVLQYNEYICYDVSQVRIRYLFRVVI